MLENLPRGIGRALKSVRPGLDKVVFNDEVAAAAADVIHLSSPAFQDGGAIPLRYTADADKLSPPLSWRGAPAGTASLVLLIEDPDAPAPNPLVHAIVWGLIGVDGDLSEGALKSPGSDGEDISLGRNSFLGVAYLPPDPPPGHGPHHYAFQIFALDQIPDLHGSPSRSQLVQAMQGHIIAKGSLIGVYERP